MVPAIRRRRAGADDDEGQQRRAPRRIGLELGLLERDGVPAPQGGGVLERFQAGANGSQSSWPK